MKNLQKSLVILLTLVFLFTSSVTIVMADETWNSGADKAIVEGQEINDETTDEIENEDEEEGIEENDDKDEDEVEDVDEDENEGEDRDKGKGKDRKKGKDVDEDEAEDEEDAIKKWEAVKNALEAQKDVIETQKDELEQQKDNLEKQYEEAVENGNLEMAGQLLGQIQQIRTQLESMKQEMKQIKEQIKETIRNKYSSEELANLQRVSEELKKNNKDIEVIPVENIVAKGVNIKFDTPPVIKHNRTLVPVRALAEAFGATVTWNQEEKKVTITRDGTEIILQLENRIAYVNGTEIEIDVPAQSLNSRTVVPLRFIVEKLGLKIDWDQDTGIIEIEDPGDNTQTEGSIDNTQVEDSADNTR